MIKQEIKNNLKQLNVLFVDDEEFVVETMKEILPILFKDSFFALNGKDGITIVENNKIDIIITDLSMPKMSGIDMLKNIYKIDSNIKCICVSGHNENNFLDQAKELRCQYIIKPINSKQLYAAFSKVLEK